MPEAKTKKRAKVKARDAIVVVVGARPPEWRKVIKRDRHTHQLVEVVLNEIDPIDEGDQGRTYVFARNEEVEADHEAVLDCPGAFAPVDDD